jgi:hypothetical protein
MLPLFTLVWPFCNESGFTLARTDRTIPRLPPHTFIYGDLQPPSKHQRHRLRSREKNEELF